MRKCSRDGKCGGVGGGCPVQFGVCSRVCPTSAKKHLVKDLQYDKVARQAAVEILLQTRWRYVNCSQGNPELCISSLMKIFTLKRQGKRIAALVEASI